MERSALLRGGDEETVPQPTESSSRLTPPPAGPSSNASPQSGNTASTPADIPAVEIETRDATPTLHPLFEQDAKTIGLPDLKYMPALLRTGFMCAGIAFNLAVFGFLIFFFYKSSFTLDHEWSYFVIQILPPIVGTMTSSHMRAVLVSLFRITPFMLAAAPQGSTFEKSILASYFPGLSILSALRTRNDLVVCGWIVDLLVKQILALKSSLLNTERYSDYVEAVVTEWAVLALIAIYVLAIVFNVVLACALHNRVTGLRWDPTSIADHLALFRHSDFLDEFEGTDMATRESIEDRFQHKSLRLGYWRRGEEIWHGFGALHKRDRHIINPRINQSVSQFELQNLKKAPRALHTQKYSPLAILETRYRAAWLNFQHSMAYFWIPLTLVLFTGSVLGLVKFPNGRFYAIPYGWAVAIFQFLPLILIDLYDWFWDDIDLFARSTQPFRGLVAPNEARKTLLLDYSTLPPLVVTYSAFSNEDYRVAYTSIMALLQRILPIIAAGATTVVPDGEGAIIYASKPLFIIVAVWLGLYCVLIPIEVFGWNAFDSYGNRHLPRCYQTISDLVTWAYASKLLRSSNGDAFDINMLDEKKTEQWYMNARLVVKPGNSEQELAQYAFGLYESVEHKGLKCMGFDVASNVETVKRRKWRAKEDAEAAEQSIVMHAMKANGLVHVLGEKSERHTNTQPLLQQTIPDQGQEA